MTGVGRRVVLASGSLHRARLLRDAGIAFTVAVPSVDERSFDPLFDPTDPGAHAVRLASAKAADVAASKDTDPSALVLAADQLAVLGETMLTKPSTPAAAVEQLVAMSGSTHSLVNGVVVLDPESGREESAVDVNVVTMTAFSRSAAERYVDHHRPFDAVGGYRIEDDAGLVGSVEGSTDGVIGLPLDVVRDLLSRFC